MLLQHKEKNYKSSLECKFSLEILKTSAHQFKKEKIIIVSVVYLKTPFSFYESKYGAFLWQQENCSVLW